MSETFEPRNELEKRCWRRGKKKSAVLEKMGRDFSIALNPGLDVGFDMEPETVNELADSLGQKARH